MMKFLICVLIPFCVLIAQAQKKVEVGDMLPKFPLGKVINKSLAEKKFSDFKGKLVILEFWHTYCGACIEEFSHLEALQRQFKDSIQIILVNNAETMETIQKRQKQLNFSFPDLPCIVENPKFHQVFSGNITTGTLWVNGEGRVVLRGGPINNHEDKIRECLAGKKIDFLPDGVPYDKGPYGFGNTALRPLCYSAFFPFEPRHSDGLQTAIGSIDSVNGTVRNTYINIDIGMHCRFLFRDSLEKTLKEAFVSQQGTWEYLKLFNFYVKDTLRYTHGLITEDRKFELTTDVNWRRGNYCYEQVLPLGTSPAVQKKLMEEDLKRFLLTQFGAQLSVGKATMPCYWLVANKDRLKPVGASVLDKGQEGRRLTGNSFFEALSELVEPAVLDGLMVFDATSYKGPVDIVVPQLRTITSREELERILDAFGLSIVKGTREVFQVTIKERDKKGED